MNLRWSLSRAVNLSFIFTWDDGEIEVRAKVFTSPLFEGSPINNDELRDILTRTKCMAMQTWLEMKRQNYESQIHMLRDYLVNHLYLHKIKLKGPLSRDSHFKIYIRSKFRGNRGSRQNFHGIPFSKDRVLINPSHQTYNNNNPTHFFYNTTYFSILI